MKMIVFGKNRMRLLRSACVAMDLGARNCRSIRSVPSGSRQVRCSMARDRKNHRTPPGRSGKFSVRDYPFFFMHKIIFKNNQNIGEALKHLHLTPVVWRILALLQERDGISIGELSQESLIERTLLSRILTGLERKTFVRREPD